MGNNPKNKNYYWYPLWMLLMIVGITLTASYVPSFSIFNAESKIVDILSDIKIDSSNQQIISYNLLSENTIEPNYYNPSDSLALTAESAIESTANIADTMESVANTTDTAIVEKVEEPKTDSKMDSSVVSKAKATPIIRRHDTPTITIEDYTNDKSTLNHFKKALETRVNKNVRIAFIGDSFIEGDILSGDIRESLQDEYGGSGVGFVPVTSVSAKYRTTIQHSFANWKSYTIKKKNSTNIDNKFIFSSTITTPIDSTSVLSYKTTHNKRNLTGCNRATFYFINEKNTTITVVINDKIIKSYTPPSSDLLQEIEITDNGNEIKSLNFKFKSPSDFYAYGVMINSNSGINVDNFSERGSSGMPLQKLSDKQTMAFGKYADYKLIVLQFGLNVLTKGKNDYSYFENTMVKIVNNIKEYYPKSSIIIMGISDRSVKVDDKYISMPEINSLRNHQRNIAKRTSVAYWDTYDAMSENGGIQKFVENHWAAKDHVHVNVAGARVIAEEFVKSLKSAIK